MKKLDKMVTSLYSALYSALDKACPEKTVTPTAGKNCWAQDSHVRSKAHVSKLYSRAKKTARAADWEAYKEADKRFKKLCHRDRNRAWRLYKETIQSQHDMASLARLAQRQEGHSINVLKKPNGSTTLPGTDTIKLLTETHFPSATETKTITYNNKRNISSQQVNAKYSDWINPHLITQALAGFEKKKNPGPDGVKPLVFEHLPQEFILTLQHIYKSAIHLGYTPKEWRRTKVIYISKPGKQSYEYAKSFRPISPSNYFLKGLERLVAWNMDKALIQYPIHHKQHGFISGRGTESAISNTVNYIEKHNAEATLCGRLPRY